MVRRSHHIQNSKLAVQTSLLKLVIYSCLTCLSSHRRLSDIYFLSAFASYMLAPIMPKQAAKKPAGAAPAILASMLAVKKKPAAASLDKASAPAIKATKAVKKKKPAAASLEELVRMKNKAICEYMDCDPHMGVEKELEHRERIRDLQDQVLRLGSTQ